MLAAQPLGPIERANIMGLKSLLKRCREHSTTRALLGAVLLVLFGVLGFAASLSWLSLEFNPVAFPLATSLSALFTSIGVLSALWEVLHRRLFAEKLFELASISQELKAAGVSQIAESFRGNELDWKELLSEATQLDIFVCWAKTWRNENDRYLRGILKRGGSINVILPDYKNPPTVTILSTHFKRAMEGEAESCKSEEEIIEEIKNAVEFYRKLARTTKSVGRVSVFLTPRIPLFSWYRINNAKAIFAFYPHRAKAVAVPAIVCREGGHLFAFARQEIEYLLREASDSRQVEPEATET